MTTFGVFLLTLVYIVGFLVLSGLLIQNGHWIVGVLIALITASGVKIRMR